MTDIEFANCNLEKYNDIYNNRKKFYELNIGDPIYLVAVEIKTNNNSTPIERFDKYKLNFYGMELINPYKPKARKAKVYLTPDKKGILADKNVSTFVKYKKIYKGQITLLVYGTTLEECIFKAEHTTKLNNIEQKLNWKQLAI